MEIKKNIFKNIDKGCFNIWRYANFYEPKIKEKYRLSLGEGWTDELRFHQLEKELNLKCLYLKRDDLNPTGSFKDRSLCYQVSKALQDGQKELVISSSGNAALAAVAYAHLAHIKLYVLVSPETNKFKLKKIEEFGAEIIVSEKPINLAKYISRKYHLINLRPSTSDTSIEGFKSIALEIFEKIGTIDSIFSYVSSASSLVGMGRLFSQLKEGGMISKMPELHAVQAGRITSVASFFDDDTLPEEISLIGDLGVKKSRRAREAIELIKRSSGSGWVVSNKNILEAQNLLNKFGTDNSPEGIAAFAGLMKALKKREMGKTLCLLSGRAWPQSGNFKIKSHYANTFDEVDKILSRTKK